jgi:hypothetical protein
VCSFAGFGFRLLAGARQPYDVLIPSLQLSTDVTCTIIKHARIVRRRCVLIPLHDVSLEPS